MNPDLRSTRPVRARALLNGAALVLLAGSLGWLTVVATLRFGTSRLVPVIGVKWAAGASPRERLAAERTLQLLPYDTQESRYLLLDSSPPALRDLVSNPLVEDTQGLVRGPNTLAAPPMVRWWLGDSYAVFKTPALIYLASFVCLASLCVWVARVLGVRRRHLVGGIRAQHHALTPRPMTAAVQRRVAWVLAAALVCSYAYFYPAGG